MEGDEMQRIASSLLDTCAPGRQAPALPALNAISASLLLHHLCCNIGVRHLEDADAIILSHGVKYVQSALCGVSSMQIQICLQKRAAGHQRHRKQLQVCARAHANFNRIAKHNTVILQ